MVDCNAADDQPRGRQHKFGDFSWTNPELPHKQDRQAQNRRGHGFHEGPQMAPLRRRVFFIDRVNFLNSTCARFLQN